MQSVPPSIQSPKPSASPTPLRASRMPKVASSPSRKPTQPQDVLSSLTLKLDKLLLNQQEDGSIPLPERFRHNVDEADAVDTFSRKSPSPASEAASEKTDADRMESPFQRSTAPTPDTISRSESPSASMVVDSPVERPGNPFIEPSRTEGNTAERKKRKFSDALAAEEGEPSVESPRARRK